MLCVCYQCVDVALCTDSGNLISLEKDNKETIYLFLSFSLPVFLSFFFLPSSKCLSLSFSLSLSQIHTHTHIDMKMYVV